MSETSWGIAREIEIMEEVHNRALRQYLADLPDPVEFARYLPEDVATALAAPKVQRSGMAVDDEATAALLRSPYGLVEFGGRHLTNFGIAVRRALIEGEA